MKNITVFLLVFVFGLHLNAQLNLPSRNIGGKEYYYRQVKKKETIYGISKELGISKDIIIKYNPSVASGLKKDQWLYFPVEDFAKTHETRKSSHIHTVKQGETLYGISKSYDLSIEDLVKANPELANGLKSGTTIKIPLTKESQLTPYVIKPGETLYRVALNNNVTIDAILNENPGISASNFKAGETIMIPPVDDNELAKNSEPETVFVARKVEKGESFESVANDYNIAASQLKDANPHTEKLKKGSYIYVPVTQERDSLTSEEVTEKYNTVHKIDKIEKVTISMMLPFDCNSEKPSQKSQLFRDFYGGFLLALNDFTDKDIKIEMNAYDTSIENISEIIGKPAVKKSNFIFIAGSDNDIAKVAEFGKENDINVVNAFDVNNDSFYENDRFFQINTPSSYMYSAIRNFVGDKFKDYKIVFIDDEDTSTSKPLIEHLKSTNIARQTIDLSELCDVEIFRTIVPDDKKILFVPTQSNKQMLASLKKGLSNLQKEAPYYNFSLLGYPEWLNYADYSQFFHAADTYIYARYAADYAANRQKRIDKEYMHYFKRKPARSVPQMDIFGHDLATYFINSIIENNNDFNKSSEVDEYIETCIGLKRASNWGGFVNTAVFLINYKPDKTIKRSTIQ